MSITGIEKFTQRTRRLAFTACALAAVGTGTLLGSMPSIASAAPVSHSAVAKAHSHRLPFGVSKGQVRQLAEQKTSASAADVSSVQAPDIKCYGTGSGGIIEAMPWDVNYDGRNTAYFAAVLQWTSAGWTYIGAAADPDTGVQVQTFNDSVFGVLADSPMDLTVNGHGLFEVVYVGQSSGDTGYTTAIGDVVTPLTFANETTCEF